MRSRDGYRSTAMIHDVDESLRGMFRRDVLNGSKVDISFEAPNKDWAARRQGPTLNLYLYDIREDLDRREVQYQEIRDENGRITGRKMPPRRFKLSYLITAWTQRPEDEHRLLSSVLSAVISADTIPAEVLEGDLAEWAHLVRVTIGLPLPQDRSISDVWTALGGELKPSLDLVVTVPFPARTQRFLEVGPWVLEEPRFGFVTPDGERETAQSRPRVPAETVRDADGNIVQEEPVTVAEERFRGTNPRGDGKGREFVIKTLPREE
jgi:hypothetical protein